MFVTSSTGPASSIYEIFPDGTASTFSTGYSYPTSITSVGNDLYVTNSGDGTIDRIDSTTGAITTIISGTSSLTNPFGISTNELDTLYILDHITGHIYSSDFYGNLNLLGTLSPYGVVYTGVNNAGDLFISDINTAEIYKIDANGIMNLFASGFAGRHPPINGPHDYLGICT